MSHVKLFTKAPREGASFITSQSELGVIGGGCGGWGGGGGVAKIGAVAKGAWWLFRRPQENRPPLMLLMLAWACRLMLLMLVVSWPRCLGVSADAADAGRIVATLCVLL